MNQPKGLTPCSCPTPPNPIRSTDSQRTDPAWRAGATGYLALGAGSPDEASPLAGELTYTGYARIAMTSATAWPQRRSRTNANLLQWGKRTDAGATQTATHAI